MTPKFLKKLMFSLAKLPNIGTKTASKLSLFLAEHPEQIQDLVDSLKTTLETVEICPKCFSYKEKDKLCEYCQAPQRDKHKLCVVEHAQDVLNIEQTGFNGVYHVLQGIISPINNVGINDIRFNELKNRIQNEDIKELIFAFTPSIEAEATILELTEHLKTFNIEISMLAQGVPAGFGIEYLDQYTLQQAFENRKKL